ncbi:hypothetical protein AMK59_1157 [Oryctes borbonicus]|uniref:Tubulin delta chain n=1 Tax=Oryctes borbonicus TaxID=1629725 RepID=A0A0T6BE13_9SCAR|nr:hypothetical protein AMK59_1157 [Oryctes borbonicus]
MSNITLQFGQCGNQVGQALYSSIYEDIKTKGESYSKNANNEYIQEATNLWFHTKKSGLEARSLLIDTEEKVTYHAKNKAYKFKNVISGSYGGSANNWAFGYSSRSQLVAQDVMEKLRREVEKCDFITCLLNILSSSGGTGSGVGSRIIEMIREEYSSKYITNIIILPFRKGDTVTQNYNTILTLSKLYDIADNTILFENDKLFDISKKLTFNSEVKLSNLNQVIALQLASITQPVKDVSFSQLISCVATHPSYNFIQVRSAPQLSAVHLNYESIPNWPVLTNQVFKSSKSDILLNTGLAKKIRYVGNVLITRGNINVNDMDLRRFREPSMYVSWVTEGEKIIQYGQQRQLLNYQKFISLLTNSNNICNTLDHIIKDAWDLFIHGAYVHHYKKYGVDDEYFLEAFQKMENILHDYKML